MTLNDVTATPKLRPAMTRDGVCTGMWITLADAVALNTIDWQPVKIAKGSCISGVTSSGDYQHPLGVMGARVTSDNLPIAFRARATR